MIGDDERAVDEPGDEIDDLVHLEVVAIDVAHGLGRRRCASGREHGEPTEHRLFSWDEQAVAPVDRGLHRAARRQFAAYRRAQQRVPIVHPLDELGQLEHPQAVGRHLDGQGQAVNGCAQLIDLLAHIVVGRVEAATGTAGTIGEQHAGVHRLHRCDRDHGLTGDRQRLA